MFVKSNDKSPSLWLFWQPASFSEIIVPYLYTLSSITCTHYRPLSSHTLVNLQIGRRVHPVGHRLSPLVIVSLLLIAFARLALQGRLQPRAEGHLHVPIDADGGKKHPVEVRESDGAVGDLVDEVAKGVLVEVQEEADDRPSLDAAVSAIGVLVAVQKPASLVVNVHAPRLVILPCKCKKKK